MIAAPRPASRSASKAPASERRAYVLYVASVLIALAASAVLVAVVAQAAEPAAPPPLAAAPGVSTSTAVPVATSTVRYSAKDIDRAFTFMDANQDGIISREEAARFRNVARHFDEADTNKDNALSPAEFSSALNRP